MGIRDMRDANEVLNMVGKKIQDRIDALWATDADPREIDGLEHAWDRWDLKTLQRMGVLDRRTMQLAEQALRYMDKNASQKTAGSLVKINPKSTLGDVQMQYLVECANATANVVLRYQDREGLFWTEDLRRSGYKGRVEWTIENEEGYSIPLIFQVKGQSVIVENAGSTGSVMAFASEDVTTIGKKLGAMVISKLGHEGKNASTQSLKDQLVRLGSTNPELRPHIRPILASVKRAAPESITSPGKPSDHPDVVDFLKSLEKSYRRHLDGFIKTRASKKFGHNSIFVEFTLLPKNEWKGGIIDNDPAHHTIWMHDSYDENGLKPTIAVEKSQGGSITDQSWDSHKIGWRNGKGSPSAVLRKFDKYFQKMSRVAEKVGF